MITIPVQRPHGLAQMLQRFGDPKLRLVQGVWVVDQGWEARNMTMLYHPMIPHPEGFVAGRLYIHRAIHDPLARTLNRWGARQACGDPYQLLHLACFNPRAKRGIPDEPSTHGFGVAIDANPDTNPMVECSLDDPRRLLAWDGKAGFDLPMPWVEDAEAEGFFWGGRFENRFDPMHLQLCDGY